MESSARSLSRGHHVAPWDAVKAALGQLTRSTTLEVGQKGTLRCLSLVGALDKRIAREIKAQARSFAEQESAGWAIDLSGVTAWDSEGLASLVYALDVSELANKPLSLLNPSSALRQTLERAQLHRLFTIVTSE